MSPYACPLALSSGLFNPVVSCVSFVQTEVCACSDVLLCKLSAVLPCVTALLTTEEDPVSRPSPPPPPLSSLLSADFFFFYCAVMTLLCAFYYCLLT